MQQSIWFSGLIFLLLVACTPKNIVFEPVQPSAEKGSVVYVYRLSAMANSMVSPALLLNGRVVTELKSGSYFYSYINSGQHIFSLKLGERYKGNKKIV